MAWLSLVLGGLFEIGWPIGLKNGWTATGLRPGWLIFAALCMMISGGLLLYAQRFIPIGTAYAVWTGIGAVGALILGIFLFDESAALPRLFFAGLIVVGILGLKATAGAAGS